MSVKSEQGIDNLVEVAHDLARLSSEVILPYFRRQMTVENKSGIGGFDPVTAADRAAEEIIRHELGARFPGHGIIGEEYGVTRGDAEYCWIVDPIDGTRSFVMGLPTWGTLIGLSRNGEPLLGLVNQPFTGERFWNAGRTAHYRGPDGTRTIATRACPDLGSAILSSTTPDMFRNAFEWERFLAVRHRARMTRFGGDCMAYCLLAMGQIDVVIESSLESYDIRPMIPLIEAAGGRVTTWDGGRADNGGRIVAAGDPRLHDEVLRILDGP